tara:strand:- start:5235 stop:5519 length:285 start_codon:yes stop_codon:yes gene_type:complete
MDHFINDKENILPKELILKIFIEHKGIENPTALIMKDYINNYSKYQYKCWYCKKSDCALAKVPTTYITHKYLLYIENEILSKSDGIYLCFDCAN